MTFRRGDDGDDVDDDVEGWRGGGVVVTFWM